MLAQRLQQQDMEPEVIDGPEKSTNINNIRCYLMFGRSDHFSIPARLFDLYVSLFGWSAVSPSRPARSQSASRSGGQGKRAAARSHAQPPLCGEHGEHGEHWTLMAAAGGATLDQAGCIQTSAALGDHGYMGASFLIGSSRSSNSRSMRFAIPRCRSTSRGHARSRASAASVSSSFRLSRNRSE